MITSPAQGMHRKAIPAEQQDVAIGGRRVHDCTLFEECVVDGFMLHENEAKQFYASIFKKRGTGAQVRTCSNYAERHTSNLQDAIQEAGARQERHV